MSHRTGCNCFDCRTSGQDAITRDQTSQDAKSLAEDLCPWPLTLEEAWKIIEDRLDKVRADAHAAGRDDERARGPRDSIDL